MTRRRLIILLAVLIIVAAAGVLLRISLATPPPPQPTATTTTATPDPLAWYRKLPTATGCPKSVAAGLKPFYPQCPNVSEDPE